MSIHLPPIYRIYRLLPGAQLIHQRHPSGLLCAVATFILGRKGAGFHD
ncbi:MAG: hypothetical protein ORN29_02150 [Rhodoferax sp.]|nr:hypothetical protein [Rhodoferax sp.]